MDDLIRRSDAIEAVRQAVIRGHGCDYGTIDSDVVYEVLSGVDSAQPEIKTDGDTISRQAAIDAIEKAKTVKSEEGEIYVAKYNAEMNLTLLPSAQPEPLSDAYMDAVWTWLIDYQIKAAELKGRYTPYEVLSWVVNDWRKEHERFD